MPPEKPGVASDGTVRSSRGGGGGGNPDRTPGRLVGGQTPRRSGVAHLCAGLSWAATGGSRLWRRTGSPRGARAACAQGATLAGPPSSRWGVWTRPARASAWDAEDASVRSGDSTGRRTAPGRCHHGQCHCPPSWEEDAPHNLRCFPDCEKHFSAAEISP